MADQAIEVDHLTKTFRKYHRKPGLIGGLSTLFSRRHTIQRAVDDVSFTVPAGAKVAYIGSNGSGKSTTIKMLTGILTPTSGRCVVHGIEPYRDRVGNARNIGVVFGQRTQLWWDLSVADSFRILGRIYDVPRPLYDRNLKLFRDLLDIDALGNVPVRQLSLGQRMRAEIAGSLLHSPEVVFWDEPTIGLDLVLKEAVRSLVNHVNRENGTTVFLTSHDLGDISAVCDQAIVLDRGRVVHEGTIQALLRTASHRSVVFEYRGAQSRAGVASTIERELPGARVNLDEEPRVTVSYPVTHFSSRQILAWILQRYDVGECYAPEPDLQSVLRDIYGSTPAGRDDAVGSAR